MKAFITSLLVAALLFTATEIPRPTTAQGQSAIIILAMLCAAGAGGMLIWVLDKNSTTINMRWVILERKSHADWCPIETNRVPVAPTKLEAFPAFFVVSVTNGFKIYRVRLAEDWEIPQSFVPSIRIDAEAQPVIVDTNKLSELLTQRN